MTLHPQFITNRNGRKTSVILTLEEYNQLMNELDLNEDILLYKKSKSRKSEYFPAEDVFRRIESKRKKK